MSSRATDSTAGRRPARRAVAVLPARIGSTRLARKMLLEAAGAPLVVHSARNALATGLFARVVVAADDESILQAVRAFGLDARATRADHQSGTDRVDECVRALIGAGEHADVVVNVQADEPELAREDLARLLAAFDDPTVEMATLAVPLDDQAAFLNQNVVKVVRDARGDALYFSRAPIPSRSHPGADGPLQALRHLGVYAFTPAALQRFCALPRGTLEQAESLEQLRWLEHGQRLRVVTASRAPSSIDTLSDWQAFVARVESSARGGSGAAGSARTSEARAGNGNG